MLDLEFSQKITITLLWEHRCKNNICFNPRFTISTSINNHQYKTTIDPSSSKVQDLSHIVQLIWDATNHTTQSKLSPQQSNHQNKANPEQKNNTRFKTLNLKQSYNSNGIKKPTYHDLKAEKKRIYEEKHGLQKEGTGSNFQEWFSLP